MTVFNFGSINIDHFYRLPHLPGPGETLAATGYDRGLGGKGANQSVAAHRAGGDVVHIGMVGPDGSGRRELAGFGVDVRFVGTEGRVTGHANVHVDAAGENMIVVLPGANHEQSLTLLKSALAEARPGDHFMLQGEAILIEDDGEIPVGPGDILAWPAGEKNGHRLHNRGDIPCVFIAISGGDRDTDRGEYPDIDMVFTPEGYFRKDGTPYPTKRVP